MLSISGAASEVRLGLRLLVRACGTRTDVDSRRPLLRFPVLELDADLDTDVDHSITHTPTEERQAGGNANGHNL